MVIIMQPRKIRAGLFLRIAITIFFVILLFALAIHQFILNPVLEHIVDSELRQHSVKIQDDVNEIIYSTERQLFVARDYAVEGMWGEGDVVGFTHLFMPVLRNNQTLS